MPHVRDFLATLVVKSALAPETCAFLATLVGKVLVCTPMCRRDPCGQLLRHATGFCERGWMNSSARALRTAPLPDMFTTEEALAVGLTRRDLAGPDFRQLFWGAYARHGAQPSYAEQVSFGLRVVPAAKFACQHTAARLLGGVVPAASNLHLGAPTRHQCTRDGLVVHYYTHPPELVLVKGIHVTSPAQTYLDLARSLEFSDLLVLGDSLVRRTEWSPTHIRQFVAASSAHGARHAREVAELVRSKVDSPNESRLRLLLVSGGLPEPAVNHEIRTEWRTAKRRIDLCYEKWKVAIEFDGRHHIDRVHQWEDDILRREELEAMGWRFIVVTSSEMYREPLRVLQRVVDALAAAGAPSIRISDDWRRHFA